MVIAEMNEKSQDKLSNPNILAKKAKKDINQMGYTNIICPICNVSPKITRTTKGERTIVSCECGYIHDIEINF